MEPNKRRRVTQEEIDKALNPELTDATATLCGKSFKVLVMPLNKEQVFLKELKALLPSAPDTAGFIKALSDIDPDRLCVLAERIAQNSGETFTAEQIAESTRLVDIISAIETQVNEQGYLDFLARIAAALPGMLSAKQSISSN